MNARAAGVRGFGKVGVLLGRTRATEQGPRACGDANKASRARRPARDAV